MRHRCLPSPLKNKVCVIRHSTFGRLGITHGLLETVNGILIYLFFTFSARLDELRCHCNLPVCVTTGYMCKSAMGTCFSEIVDRTDLSKSRHGCLELLTRYISAPYNQEKKHFKLNVVIAFQRSSSLPPQPVERWPSRRSSPPPSPTTSGSLLPGRSVQLRRPAGPATARFGRPTQPQRLLSW